MGVALATSSLTGCGSGSGSSSPDHRFTAETYDENTEALTNAVISSPSGVVVVGGGDAGTAEGGVGGSSGGVSGGSSSSSSSSGGGAPDASDDGGFGDGGTTGQFGLWHFDDCSAGSHFLVDSSGLGANATHALNGACVPGISGLGVAFRSAKDLVQVPDEPQFTVSSRVAVAAWVYPNTVTGDQPIVLKRLNNQTSFSLGVHKGNVEMAVVLTSGKTFITQAPITAKTWSHVAGMYDGTFVYLFIDGQQFGQVYAGGNLRDVFAPLRIGATTQTQHFDGVIDEVFVSTDALSKDAVTALACLPHPATVSVSPATSGPVPFDTQFHYAVNVTNNDVGFCQPASYEFFLGGSDPNITAVADQPQFVSGVAPGGTAAFGAEVSGSSDADPGVHVVPFQVFEFSPSFQFLFGQLNFELAAPTGCFVRTRRELMITDVSVVDDPVRTAGVFDPGFTGGDAGSGPLEAGSFDAGPPPPSSEGGPPGPPPVQDGGPVTPSTGVWTFGHLMRELAPTPADAPAMTERLFDSWLTDQSVNGFVVAARPAMQQVLLGIWPRTSDGALDLDHPPLRLQAIVNRLDLRNLSAGSAGEGRFVFAVNGAGFPQSFTVILEYNLPAKTAQDVSDWANLWHGLSSLPFPSEAYNSALEAITRRFSSRGSQASGVNGNALISLRTNEIALDGNVWQFREFMLSPANGFFQETTIKETPDLSFNGTQTFADFVNANAPAIVAEVPGRNDGTVPLQFEGSPFLAGAVFNQLIEWSAPGILDDNARFHASLNTCNGCHGPETNTSFTQINPRFPGSEATLSPFLTGTVVTDPAGVQRTINDLSRRRIDLTQVVCGSDGGAPPPPPPPPPPGGDAGAG